MWVTARFKSCLQSENTSDLTFETVERPRKVAQCYLTMRESEQSTAQREGGGESVADSPIPIQLCTSMPHSLRLTLLLLVGQEQQASRRRSMCALSFSRNLLGRGVFQARDPRKRSSGLLPTVTCRTVLPNSPTTQATQTPHTTHINREARNDAVWLSCGKRRRLFV